MQSSKAQQASGDNSMCQKHVLVYKGAHRELSAVGGPV